MNKRKTTVQNGKIKSLPKVRRKDPLLLVMDIYHDERRSGYGLGNLLPERVIENDLRILQGGSKWEAQTRS